MTGYGECFQQIMTSSPRSPSDLPTKKVAGGISMGLNNPRRKGTLSFLSQLTLWMQAPMRQYAIQPLSLKSASGQMDLHGETICFRSLSFPLLPKGNSQSQMLKNESYLLSADNSRQVYFKGISPCYSALMQKKKLRAI